MTKLSVVSHFGLICQRAATATAINLRVVPVILDDVALSVSPISVGPSTLSTYPPSSE
jgi:hypothetical protein